MGRPDPAGANPSLSRCESDTKKNTTPTPTPETHKKNKTKKKQVFEGHSHYVMQVALNPKDPSTFATASLDRTVKVWSLGQVRKEEREKKRKRSQKRKPKTKRDETPTEKRRKNSTSPPQPTRHKTPQPKTTAQRQPDARGARQGRQRRRLLPGGGQALSCERGGRPHGARLGLHDQGVRAGE